MRSASALIIIVCAIALSARAGEAAIGFIKTLSGTATVTHGANSASAALAMPVYDPFNPYSLMRDVG
jgi:hypothetical protein